MSISRDLPVCILVQGYGACGVVEPLAHLADAFSKGRQRPGVHLRFSRALGFGRGSGEIPACVQNIFKNLGITDLGHFHIAGV